VLELSGADRAYQCCFKRLRKKRRKTCRLKSKPPQPLPSTSYLEALPLSPECHPVEPQRERLAPKVNRGVHSAAMRGGRGGKAVVRLSARQRGSQASTTRYCASSRCSTALPPTGSSHQLVPLRSASSPVLREWRDWRGEESTRLAVSG
jgi:hypothetical protein